GVVLEHARKIQVRPAKAEVDGGLSSGADEFREVVSRAEPRENAVAFPAPGNDFFARKVCGKMPAVLLREFFDPAVHAVIVPSKRNQDPLLPLLHGSASIAVRRYLSTTLNFARTAHAPKPHAAADFSAGSFCPGRLPDRRFDPSKCMMIRSDTGRDCVGGV